MEVMLIALAVDRIIGDPGGKYHPVALMGKIISTLNQVLYKEDEGPKAQLAKGSALWLVVVGLSCLIGYALSGNVWVEGIAMSFAIGFRSMHEEAQKVHAARNLVEARRQLQRIVSRDCNELTEQQVYKSCIESTAENTVDGAISVLMYGALGLEAAMAYRAINTLDAMVGYRGKYEYYGKTSAIADDVVNYLPARLGALLATVSALVLRYNYDGAFKELKRSALNGRHNGLWIESVTAGALGITLGGKYTYSNGKVVDHEILGENLNLVERNDIVRTIKLMRCTVALTVIVMCLMY